MVDYPQKTDKDTSTASDDLSQARLIDFTLNGTSGSVLSENIDAIEKKYHNKHRHHRRHTNEVKISPSTLRADGYNAIPSSASLTPKKHHHRRKKTQLNDKLLHSLKDDVSKYEVLVSNAPLRGENNIRNKTLTGPPYRSTLSFPTAMSNYGSPPNLSPVTPSSPLPLNLVSGPVVSPSLNPPQSWRMMEERAPSPAPLLQKILSNNGVLSVTPVSSLQSNTPRHPVPFNYQPISSPATPFDLTPLSTQQSGQLNSNTQVAQRAHSPLSGVPPLLLSRPEGLKHAREDSILASQSLNGVLGPSYISQDYYGLYQFGAYSPTSASHTSQSLVNHQLPSPVERTGASSHGDSFVLKNQQPVSARQMLSPIGLKINPNPPPSMPSSRRLTHESSLFSPSVLVSRQEVHPLRSPQIKPSKNSTSFDSAKSVTSHHSREENITKRISLFASISHSPNTVRVGESDGHSERSLEINEEEGNMATHSEDEYGVSLQTTLNNMSESKQEGFLEQAEGFENESDCSDSDSGESSFCSSCFTEGEEGEEEENLENR
eukprot:GDKJ01004565.1.p2 GENE.GDKJ01004565.1~~GDKJ01004565.1.p2  ORF type:complete len:546 (-),score=125.41 GDKJ01004565.1:2278-3915(-)